MNTNIRTAIRKGQEAGVEVQPWGSDMVRLNGALIMSAADAIRWGIAECSR